MLKNAVYNKGDKVEKKYLNECCKNKSGFNGYIFSLFYNPFSVYFNIVCIDSVIRFNASVRQTCRLSKISIVSALTHDWSIL